MRMFPNHLVAALGLAALLMGAVVAPALGQAVQVRGSGIATGTSISSETAEGQRLISQVGPVAPVGLGTADDGRTLRSGALFAFSARARSFVVERPGPVAPGTAATIRVEVDSPEPVVGAQLRYRVGSGSLESVEMDIENGAVSGEIPASAVTARGLTYFITLVDAVGAEFRAPRTGTFALSIAVDEGAIVRGDPLPGGQSQGAYRLIALPLSLDNPAPGPFLTANLGPQDNVEWRFFELIEDERVREFPNTADLEPGRGFWLIAREGGIALEAGAGRLVDLDAPFEQDIRSGWNLIGNPFNFSLPVDALALESEEGFSLRSFGPTDWNNPVGSPVEELTPFEGYALFNEGDATTLRFDPEVEEDEDALTEHQQIADAIAWTLQLRAEVGREAHASVVAGVAEGASDGWDALDHPQPPALFEDVALTFPREDWEHPAQTFSSDVRADGADGYSWAAELTRYGDNGPARLRALGTDDLPSDWAAYLVNDQAETAHDLSEGPMDISGLKAGRPLPLRLLVGSTAYLEHELGELLRPGEVVLDSGYPNPFRTQVHLRYGLPEEQHVRLQVFDTLGREVALLHDGEASTGFHEHVWDGRDRSGAPVASGVYFVRLQAEEATLTESIVRVR